MEILLRLIGAIGLVLITIGVLIKERKTRDIYYIPGGILLVIYSLYIGDLIFIILQVVFVLVAIYDFIKIISKRR